MDELMGQVAEALRSFILVLMRLNLEQDGWTVAKVVDLRERVLNAEAARVAFVGRLNDVLEYSGTPYCEVE